MREIYTKEDLEGRIREIRTFRDMLNDEECRLLMLHEAIMCHGTPVDAKGRSIKSPRKQYVPKVDPANLPTAGALRAIQEGRVPRVPAYQHWED